MLKNSFTKTVTPILNNYYLMDVTTHQIIILGDEYFAIENGSFKPIEKGVGIFYYPIEPDHYLHMIKEVNRNLNERGTVSLLTDVNPHEVLDAVDHFCRMIPSIPKQLVKDSIYFYGAWSLESYIITQLLNREYFYQENDLREGVKWYDATVEVNITVYTGGYENSRKLKVINNQPILLWFKKTLRIRDSIVTAYNDYDRLSVMDRIKLINTLMDVK